MPNTIVAFDSSTSDDMGELEIACVSCARERLKPHHHTCLWAKAAASQSQVLIMSSCMSRPHELRANCSTITEYDRDQQ